MPFDGIEFNVPLEIRLLDRAKTLIATENQWVIGQSSARVDGKWQYCLYGALLAAERELVPECVQPMMIRLENWTLYPRTDAFLRVHYALNAEARPFWLCLSRKSNHAIVWNDRARSVGQVHFLIAKARRRLLKQVARSPAEILVN
jgi:hypothetical protein